jgi:hypothetical protein
MRSGTSEPATTPDTAAAEVYPAGMTLQSHTALSALLHALERCMEVERALPETHLADPTYQLWLARVRETDEVALQLVHDLRMRGLL